MGYAIASTISHSKTKTLISLATVFAAFTAAFLILGGRAGATPGGPTCNVPVDYATIQEAVDVPGCTTIKVAAGSYTENVTINRTLTLKGAKANVDVDSRTFGVASESKVAGLITVNGPSVNINGFSLTNPNQGLGVIVKTAGSGSVISNNIIDTVGGPTYNDNSVGVYLETGPDNVKVDGNKISNIQSGSLGSAQGILVGDSTSGNPSTGIRITDNSITNLTSGAKGAYGIQLNNGARLDPTATGYTTAKIKGNTIKTLTGNWAHGIGLEGDTPNVEVTKNVISGLVDSNPVGFNDAVAVTLQDNIFFFTADINRNSLAVGATAFGIGVQPALTTLYPTLEVDGSCNYWGAQNGPGPGLGSVGTGSGSLVSTGVDYSPWLKSSKLKGDCGEKEHSDDDNHHWQHYNRYDHED